MKTIFYFFITMSVLVGLVSCEDDSSAPKYQVKTLKGAFVVNEGVLNQNNGAISFISEEDGSIDLDLFKTVNQKEVGDVVQSFSIVDTLGFIVVNNSRKVEVVHMKDFKQVLTISNLSYPRHVVKARENVIYISNGNGLAEGNDKLIVYDYKQKKKLGEIEVGRGPEEMKKVGNKIYVANSGGWGTDNTVSVIDANTDTNLKTIEVGQTSVDLEVDKNNNVWVLSKGKMSFTSGEVSENSRLFVINTSTDEVLKTIDLNNHVISWGSNLIAMNAAGDKVILAHEGVYKIDINATTYTSEKITDGSWYGVSTNPANGDIYLLSSSKKKAFIYNASGVKLSEKTVWEYPRDVIFNSTDYTEE